MTAGVAISSWLQLSLFILWINWFSVWPKWIARAYELGYSMPQIFSSPLIMKVCVCCNKIYANNYSFNLQTTYSSLSFYIYSVFCLFCSLHQNPTCLRRKCWEWTKVEPGKSLSRDNPSRRHSARDLTVDLRECRSCVRVLFERLVHKPPCLAGYWPTVVATSPDLYNSAR